MKRTLGPVTIVFVAMALSYLGYFGSRCLPGGVLQSSLAAVFGTTYFVFIAFGALYVYTASRVRGAGRLACYQR